MKEKITMNKRLASLFIAFFLVLSTVAAFSTNVQADVPPVPPDVRLYIHALRFTDGNVPTIQGDGTVLNLGQFPNVESLNTIEFTVIEVKSSDLLSENPNQAEAQAFYDAHKDDSSYIKRIGKANADIGGTCFDTGVMPSGRYLAFQNNIPVNVTTYTAPFVVSLPQMNPDGQSWNQFVHVYTKNTSTLGASRLYKYNGEYNKGTALAGAKFTLYKVSTDPEVADPIIESNLLTDGSGYTPMVSSLLPGDYYYVETSAPQGFLPNYSRYSFKVETEDHVYDVNGNIIPSKVILVGAPLGSTGRVVDTNVVNYLAPTVDKAITTPVTADIGQVNTWAITSTVPKNIADYQKFVITDTLDAALDYAGGVTVQANVGGTFTAVNPGAYNLIEPNASSNVLSVQFKDTDFGGALLQLVGATEIKITFNTKINETSIPGTPIPNSANLAYNNAFVDGTTASYHTPTVVTGGHKFLKTNTSNQTLSGAQFQIYKINNGTKYYAVQDIASLAISWDSDVANATTFTSASDGTFELRGAAYGGYYLKETVAPLGYNLLLQDKYFTIDANSYLNPNTITIQNSDRPVIPVTGGIGTILFFGGGGLLMGGALYIISKNKKSAHPKAH